MKIVFANNQTVDLGLYNTDLANVYRKIYKHLCHARLVFKPWDNPYYLDQLTHEQLVDRLTDYAQQVSVPLDRVKCLDRDQAYLNQLHKIYEDNYHGQPHWLDYHEHIHLCEGGAKYKVLDIDYREQSGMLERAFDHGWLYDSKTKVQAGDVYVTWAELGKTPYRYWKDHEPDDINRMCELVKPWLKLRPRIKIALEDIDLMDNPHMESFSAWWKNYEQAWCNHWHLQSWSVHDIFAHSVFGHVESVDTVNTWLKNNINPVGISLA